ncbi:MAG: hypothetical protein QGH70_04830 [Nitrospinota bacterium]|jgi:hypothetical protein|nr:hypothetical protein [Nitrospinota bacterium]MDP6483159.1 hypothetical protein [Nitrospinota bacterium]HJM41940.1 hypothetical protein [Nitrospinota bacterium]
MIGCLVLVGLLISAAIGKKPGALIYLFGAALYLALRNWSERSQVPAAEEEKPFAGYESPADWRRAKRIEGRLAWGGAAVLGFALYFYFTR